MYRRSNQTHNTLLIPDQLGSCSPALKPTGKPEIAANSPSWNWNRSILETSHSNLSSNNMDDLMDVAPHIHLFNEVHKEFFRRTALKLENDLDCEELYFLLYQDIRQHPAVYFDVVFELNDIYSERCAGMLCSLANILRRKNELKLCLEVLEMNLRILKIYQDRCLPAPYPRRRRRVQRGACASVL